MTPALYGRSSRPLVSGLVCQSLEVGTWPGCCSLPAAKAAPEAPAEAAPLSVRRLRRTPAAEGTACGRWRPAVTETRARRKPRGRARWRARGGERAAASKRVAGAVKICISLVFFFSPSHTHTPTHTRPRCHTTYITYICRSPHNVVQQSWKKNRNV
jgi:hypothetical protein